MSEISKDGYIKVDALRPNNLAHAEVYALMHMQLMKIKAEHPEEYEAALKRYQEILAEEKE